MKTTSKIKFMMATTAFFSVASAAFALDGADVAKKLNDAYAANGGKIEYADVAVEGTTVTFKGAKVTGQGAPADGFVIGDVVMSGVEENEDGGYNVETVKFSDVDFKDGDKSAVSIKGIAIDGLLIPGKAEPGTIDGMILYASAHTGPISISAKGKEVVSVSSIESTMGVEEDNSAMDTTFKITGLKADLSEQDDPKAKETIEKLGLQTVSGDVNIEGSWEVASGKVDITTLAIDLAKVGRLNVTLTMSGYTAEFIKAMEEAMKASAANPDKAAGDSAFGMAMMGLMQQLSFEAANVRYDDAGFTKRALDYLAAQQGTTGDALGKSIPAMIPIFMGQLNMPDLQAQVTEASTAYFADPKSIDVTAAPEKPVPVPQIMGAAMGSPTTIPTLLGVTVSANQ